MKQFASILLVFLLTWQTFFNAGAILYWKTNQAYIAQALCENKDKPQMHCGGKCYLYKQLKKAEERENEKNSFPNSIPKLKFTDHFIADDYKWNIETLWISVQKTPFSNYSSHVLIGYENSIFRPPPFI